MALSLKEELGRIFWRGLVGALVWWGSGDWRFGLIAVLALYLFSQLRNLVVLRAWLRHPQKVELPPRIGFWGEAFHQLGLMQRRNRKRKKRLARMLSEFQASTAALPDGAVVLGRYGEIVWFNTAAQTLLGLRSPQDFGLRVANLVRHPAFTAYFEQGDYEAAVEAPSPVNAGVLLSYRIIPYGRGQRLLIVRDVSDAWRLERTRRDFIANASNELHSPLVGLRNHLEKMESAAEQDERLEAWRQSIHDMRGQAERMEALVGDLLKLAALESDAIRTRQALIDVAKILTDWRQQQSEEQQARHHIEMQLDADLKLLGCEAEVASVLTNLLDNAVNYTPAGGSIKLRWWGNGQGAYFSVSDTGLGIAARDVPRITERFYRVDVARSQASGGTGLGLSIVKHALEKHEARLQVDSQPGVGSIFTCHFPVHRMHRDEPGSSTQAETAPPG